MGQFIIAMVVFFWVGLLPGVSAALIYPENAMHWFGYVLIAYLICVSTAVALIMYEEDI